MRVPVANRPFWRSACGALVLLLSLVAIEGRATDVSPQRDSSETCQRPNSLLMGYAWERFEYSLTPSEANALPSSEAQQSSVFDRIAAVFERAHETVATNLRRDVAVCFLQRVARSLDPQDTVSLEEEVLLATWLRSVAQRYQVPLEHHVRCTRVACVVVAIGPIERLSRWSLASGAPKRGVEQAPWTDGCFAMTFLFRHPSLASRNVEVGVLPRLLADDQEFWCRR
jgi:hypothetical protein